MFETEYKNHIITVDILHHNQINVCFEPPIQMTGKVKLLSEGISFAFPQCELVEIINELIKVKKMIDEETSPEES